MLLVYCSTLFYNVFIRLQKKNVPGFGPCDSYSEAACKSAWNCHLENLTWYCYLLYMCCVRVCVYVDTCIYLHLPSLKVCPFTYSWNLNSSQQLLSFKDYSELGELPPRSPLEPVCEDGPFGPVKEERKRTPRELRELWKKAIIQQILLLRMEKENQKLQGWWSSWLHASAIEGQVLICAAALAVYWAKSQWNMLGTDRWISLAASPPGLISVGYSLCFFFFNHFTLFVYSVLICTLLVVPWLGFFSQVSRSSFIHLNSAQWLSWTAFFCTFALIGHCLSTDHCNVQCSQSWSP